MRLLMTITSIATASDGHLDSSTPAPMTGEIPGAFFDRCVVGTQSSGVCKCTDMRTGESLGTTPLSTNFTAIAAANII